LPPSLKIDLLPSIAREYQWVLNELGKWQERQDHPILHGGVTR
jgi:hypothetical protein